MKLIDVKKLLDDNGYTYTQTIVLSRADFYRQKGFNPSENTGAFVLLSINNPNHTKNIELIFGDDSDNPDFYDLEFGGFWYEMFGCLDEELPEYLLVEIQRIIQGNSYIIFATDAKKNGRWFFDAIYYDLPDEEMNCMDSFHNTLSKIKSPKSLWRKLIGRTDIYEIFNWTSYEKIVK